MRFILSFLLISSTFLTTAQSPELKRGIASYEMGNYEDAVSILGDVMKARNLKSKEFAQGWFYLGKSKYVLISNAMSTKTTELMVKYQGYDLDAYDCFNKALAASPKVELKETLDREIGNLYYVLFNSGNTQYLLGNNASALQYYNTAAEISESYDVSGIYQVYNLRAQTYLAMGDSTNAYLDFATATKEYLIKLPEIPDANIGYAYYSMAIIERYNNVNLDKALELTQVGTELMQSELDRLNGMLNDGSSDQSMLAGQSAQFASIMDALNRFELDIYNASPEKYDEAVEKFKKALEENPNDANMWLVYGNLVEKADLDWAYDAYKKAIEIDASLSIGHFNAGANRVNKGVEYARMANNEADYQRSKEWQEKVNEQFNMALPHLEKSHQLEPNNMYVLDALLQVTIQLEMMDEYKMYKEKLTLLKGY